MTDPVSIGLKVTGALTLAGSVTAPLVDLAATGAIVQTGGSLTATLLTGSGASAALGSADNAVTTLGNFTTAGDFALADGQALTVGGTVSVGGGATLSLASNQISLGEASQLLAPGGTVAFAPLTPGTALTLGSFVPSGGSIVANNLRVGSATTGDIGISGMFDLSAVNALELRSAGNIIEGADAVIRVGTLTGQANSAQLLGLNQIDVLGGFAVAGSALGANAPSALTLVNGRALAVAGPVSAAAGNVVLDTRSSASADVTIAVAGRALEGNFSVLAGRGVTVAAGGSLDAASGTIRLAGSSGGAIALGGPLAATNVVLVTEGGAITQGSGTIAANGLAARGASVALDGLNRIGALGGPGPSAATGGDFSVNDTQSLAVVSSVQASGAVRLATSGDLGLEADISAPTLLLSAGGKISQRAGTITAGTLDGVSAQSAALDGDNAIATLGSFTVADQFSLRTGGGLIVAGTGRAPRLTLEAGGGIEFAGDVSSPVSLTVNSGGGIGQTGGTLQVGTLSGTAVGRAQFGSSGTAAVDTLGAFTVTDAAATSGRAAAAAVAAGATGGAALSVLGLADSTPLTVVGPLSAGTVTLSAPGLLTLQGGQITTDAASFTVAAASGSARLVQTGTTALGSLSGGTGSVALGLPAGGGSVSLQNLSAPGMALSLLLQNGSASGAIDVAGLQVTGAGGSAALTGSVAGQSGARAAALSGISPQVDVAYRLNGCTIALATCGAVAGINPGGAVPLGPVTEPGAPFTPVGLTPGGLPLVFLDFGVPLLVPKSFLDTVLGNILKPDLFTADLIAIGIVRDPADPEVLLPNISDRDY